MTRAKTNENAHRKIEWALDGWATEYQSSAIHNTIQISKPDESTRTPCDLTPGGTREAVYNRIF